MSSTENFPFLVELISPILSLPSPLTDIMSPVLMIVLLFVTVLQLTRTSPLLIKLAILVRETLNPALATASSLNDASMDFEDFVLEKVK